MDQTVYESMLSRYNVVRQGHFVYTRDMDGKNDPANRAHGDLYVAKSRLGLYPGMLWKLEKDLARCVADMGVTIDVVIGPHEGGRDPSFALAAHLSLITGRDIARVVALKGDDGGFYFRDRDKPLVEGAGALVHEDIINSGGSVRDVTSLTTSTGGIVLLCCAIYNRGVETAASLGVDCLISLVTRQMNKYPPNRCPQCEAGVPVNTDFGHGAEFLAMQAAGT